MASVYGVTKFSSFSASTVSSLFMGKVWNV
jgi:hypothetical protein